MIDYSYSDYLFYKSEDLDITEYNNAKSKLLNLQSKLEKAYLSKDFSQVDFLEAQIQATKWNIQKIESDLEDFRIEYENSKDQNNTFLNFFESF